MTEIAGQSLLRITIERYGDICLVGWEGGLFTSEVTPLLRLVGCLSNYRKPSEGKPWRLRMLKTEKRFSSLE